MYKHGAYAVLTGSQGGKSPEGVGTIPVYFGTLPVHQLEEFDYLVNQPILIHNFNDGMEKVGYCDTSWDVFTLCEAVDAHFRNGVRVIGPIILINVLDPKKHQISGEKTETITLTNGKAVIDTTLLILNTLTIGEKVRGKDYKAYYNASGTRVIIEGLGNAESSVEISYKEIDETQLTKELLIGGIEGGERTGLAVLDLVYQKYNFIPSVLCAPGWSDIAEVNKALIGASQLINGHWFAFVNTDIDCSDGGANKVEKLKEQKLNDGHVSALSACCWPMAKKGNKIYHLSTIATVTMQWVDFNNDNVPYETPSNKPIDISGLCLADGTDIQLNQVDANEVNALGIRTATYWGGGFVLWGGHTGEYAYGKDLDPKNIFDSNVRMVYHVANAFQSKYGSMVDKPMNRAVKDTILNDFQEWLDNLIGQGKLLVGHIQFDERKAEMDAVQGDFVFELAATTAPQAKSITAKISYSQEGLSTLLGGDGS